MMEEGICVGCGGDCLGIVECSCGGREVYACQDCVDSGMNLVCGVCRDGSPRADTLIPYPCGFEEVAPTGRRLPVAVPVGA